jgi:flagellar assembly factor FliW
MLFTLVWIESILKSSQMIPGVLPGRLKQLILSLPFQPHNTYREILRSFEFIFSRRITGFGGHYKIRAMSCCQSKYFGTLHYAEDAVISPPRGLLGFEQEKMFVLVQLPEQYPLVYVQSAVTPELCFLALPILTIDPEYRLELNSEDAQQLGTETNPEIGQEVLCLALIATHPEGVRANLLAPLVVNLETRAACQCFNAVPGYSHQHEIKTPGQGVAA